MHTKFTCTIQTWPEPEVGAEFCRRSRPFSDDVVSITRGRRFSTSKVGHGFARDQPWVKIRRTLNFVDETADVASIHDLESTSLEDVFDKSSPPQNTGTVAIPSDSSCPATEIDRPGSSQSSTLSYPDYPRKRRTLSHSTTVSFDVESFQPIPHAELHDLEPILDNINQDHSTFTEPTSADLPSNSQSSLLSAISVASNHANELCHSLTLQATQHWPIRDAQEAMLFGYFIHTLARLFDMCDDGLHFARVVPRRAMSCPALMNAMLAAAAKHLSRVDNFDRLVVDQYHQKCLDLLIPALSDSTAVTDENLLPAIVILRFMEELDVPIATTAPESHLIGTRVFVAAQESTCGFTGLWRAAFWLALRQEISIAFNQTRPVHPSFILENAERFIQPDSNGCAFANLMIIQCALCIRFCYGENTQSLEEWQRLKDAQDRLWEERPWMFHPLYEDSTLDPFPVEQYLNDAIVTGIQHMYLTQILMAAHNPKAPKLGPGQAIAAKETNKEIKQIVRKICGIAESNSRTAPAYLNACIAITMAGDRFNKSHEQEAFYNILVKTDTELGWPTQAAQQRMLDAWGWPKSPAVGLTQTKIIMVVNFLQEFVQSPSPNPPGDTQQVATVISNYLSRKNIPYEVIRPKGQQPNIVSDFQGGKGPGPRVVLNGHIDVFPVGTGEGWARDPWSGDVVDGRIYGRGVTDMKSGTASVALCAVSDEETGGKWGTKYLIEEDMNRWAGDLVLSAEPGGCGTVRFAEKGTLRLTGTLKTRGAHGAYLNLSKGAIRTAATYLQGVVEAVESMSVDLPEEMAEHLRKPEVRDAIDRAMGAGTAAIIARPTVNIGTIKGGYKVNMIPDVCVFELDIRLPVGLLAQHVLDRIHATKPPQGTTDIQIDVQSAASNPYSFSSVKHPIVNLLVKSAQSLASNADVPVPIPSMGATDCKHYRYAGVPAYVYGCSPESKVDTASSAMILRQMIQGYMLLQSTTPGRAPHLEEYRE
ncbi:Succinyl-diaminopimelate desuccinylase [Paramyrothecium foliicola]|nr:Succinyl-diaminopimelate desuccinylase [Paramyrothecium foliicola]